jgi:hypothetical protein
MVALILEAVTMGDAQKVWFITGTSKGFGHVWAEAAHGGGER